MDQRLDLESGTIHELEHPAPGTWQFPKNPDLCCIYRVPISMRHVNPEAYTPQFVFIGPLHHSLKSQALKSRGDITDIKSMGYLNMERHKKIYLAEFAKRVEGENIIDGFRKDIEEDEDMIRASYSESTAWIKSPEFVEMILHDSVFIVEFILRIYEKGLTGLHKKRGDTLMDEPCQGVLVKRDLILLENQLPYFLFDKLVDPIIPKLFDPIIRKLSHPIRSVFDRGDLSFRKLVTIYFLGFETKIEDYSEFRHFTDLFRCVHVETLPGHFLGEFDIMDVMEGMYHADKLHSGGVKFNAVDKKISLDVEFKNGCLNIPCFLVHYDTEMTLRNIMTLEQCHYAFNTHVCNYIWFLDFLIDTEKDVDLLIEKGIIKNCLGNHGTLATMVNRLCLGVTSFGSYYSVIAKEVKSHYDNPWNKSRAVLKSVYFSNPWRGTATVAATFLLLLTLIQTVTSIMQVLQKDTPDFVMSPP